jgi:hypothetical protein
MLCSFKRRFLIVEDFCPIEFAEVMHSAVEIGLYKQVLAAEEYGNSFIK